MLFLVLCAGIFAPRPKPDLLAATPQFNSSYSITISTNADLGLSSAANSLSQTAITSIQLQPLDVLLSNPSVNVPVDLSGTVPANGIITKSLQTSSTDYIWRLQMGLLEYWFYNLNNESETYSVAGSGNTNGLLTHTTFSSAKLPVNIEPGAQFWNSSGSGLFGNSYLSRRLDIQIDLSNVRYSGTYRANITTRVTY